MTYYKYLTADRTSPLQNWQWPRVGTWTKKLDAAWYKPIAQPQPTDPAHE